jgi:hypothetical protein
MQNVKDSGTEIRAVFTREEIREKLGIDLPDFYEAKLDGFPRNETLSLYYLRPEEVTADARLPR